MGEAGLMTTPIKNGKREARQEFFLRSLFLALSFALFRCYLYEVSQVHIFNLFSFSYLSPVFSSSLFLDFSTTHSHSLPSCRCHTIHIFTHSHIHSYTFNSRWTVPSLPDAQLHRRMARVVATRRPILSMYCCLLPTAP